MAVGRRVRTRLIVDIPPDLRHQLRLAAAEADVSVSALVERLLRQGLEQTTRGTLSDADVARLDAARAAVMKGRVFPDDSTDLLRADRLSRHGG
jgi:hypothetical protein